MTAYEIARAQMIAAVYGCVTSEEAQPLLSDHEPIQSCITDTSGHLENLDVLASAQSDKPGFAQQRQQKLKELSQLAAEICGAGLSYATRESNERLAAKFSLPLTALSKGKDSRLIANYRNIYKAASPIVDALAAFKVTPAKLKALKQKTDDYKVLSTKTRESIAARKAATERIPAVIRQATKLLRKQLDPLMVPFKATNPEFYAEYKAARRIVKPGSQAEANAKGKATGLGQLPKAA